MEHIIYYLSKICNEYRLDTCKDVEQLLSYNLPYNVLSAKLSDVLTKMSKEAREKGLNEIAENLHALSKEAQEAGVYDI
ncbi:MAG: hypothetical protein F7C32_02930 [Desulfurococcales archaeon]|nr:hypothetical protein [Desulfurococcales archaeon]